MSSAVLRAMRPSFGAIRQRQRGATPALCSRPAFVRYQRGRTCIAHAAQEDTQDTQDMQDTQNTYKPIIVNEEELEVELANRDTAIIIDFYATWCGPCVMLAKELEQVAQDLGDKVRVLKVDVDKNERISSALQIQGLPTMIFIGTNKEKPSLRMEGFVPAATIKEILAKEM